MKIQTFKFLLFFGSATKDWAKNSGEPHQGNGIRLLARFTAKDLLGGKDLIERRFKPFPSQKRAEIAYLLWLEHEASRSFQKGALDPGSQIGQVLLGFRERAETFSQSLRVIHDLFVRLDSTPFKRLQPIEQLGGRRGFP